MFRICLQKLQHEPYISKMFYQYEGLGPQLVMLSGRGVESFEHGHKWYTRAIRYGP